MLTKSVNRLILYMGNIDKICGKILTHPSTDRTAPSFARARTIAKMVAERDAKWSISQLTVRLASLAWPVAIWL